VQRQLHPAFFLTILIAVALVGVVVVCVDSSLAQDYPNTGSPYPATQSPYPVTQSPYGSPYGVVPSAPSQPAAMSRPPAWPATAGPVAAGQPPMHGQQLAPSRAPMSGPPMEPCESTQILARVGSEVILASEVIAAVPSVIEMGNRRLPEKLRLSPEKLEQQREQLTKEVALGVADLASGEPMPSGPPTDELAALRLQRRALVQQLLAQLVETRLLYCDAKRSLPAEGFPQIVKSIGKQFDEMEVESLIKQEGVGSRRELEQKLRARGSSLDREKKAFTQRILAQQWLQNQIKSEEEITHDEMLEYYHLHGEQFDHPARVEWKELMVRFSQYRTREEAGAAISQMGNQVFSGVPFEQVAKAHSDGSTASDGGRRDWTTKGSLVSEVLDRELFNPNLRVGTLSPIIESEKGFHILVITQRENAHRTPFAEVQTDIQAAIRRERSSTDLREYVVRLRDQIPVWVVFDEESGSEELAERPGHPRR